MNIYKYKKEKILLFSIMFFLGVLFDQKLEIVVGGIIIFLSIYLFQSEVNVWEILKVIFRKWQNMIVIIREVYLNWGDELISKMFVV